MATCDDLLIEIVSAQGQASRARDEIARYNELLSEIAQNMTIEDTEIRARTDEVNRLDSEIAEIIAEARRLEIAEIDAELQAIEERIAELQSFLDGGLDAPPASEDEAGAISREMERLETDAEILADTREKLENGQLDPKLTSAEQAEVDARTQAKDTAERLRDEAQARRDLLPQLLEETKGLQDVEFDNEEAADDLEAALQAEARAAGCDFAEPDPEQPAPEDDEPEVEDPEEPEGDEPEDEDPEDEDPEEPEDDEPEDEDPAQPEDDEPEDEEPEEPEDEDPGDPTGSEDGPDVDAPLDGPADPADGDPFIEPANGDIAVPREGDDAERVDPALDSDPALRTRSA